MKEELSKKDYIINCAGEKVPVADAGFTSRCAVGNTDDYLESVENFISPQILSLGDPARISIIIPSFASDEKELHCTLMSLCAQQYPEPVEIVVFINEPENAPENIRLANDRNENLVRLIVKDLSKNITPEILYSGNIRVRCVRQVVAGGLAGVYQIVSASWVARARIACDRIAQDDRQKKIKCIEDLFARSLVLLCDDDMEIEDAQAIGRAYQNVVDQDAVVLGKLYIKNVDTVQGYRRVLRDVMQLFLDFKYDQGLNFLTPRGMLLAHILKAGKVDMDKPFADQMFFAAIARGRPQHFINVRTGIGESDYPGNGNFLKRLRLYLEGQDNGALDIFDNVLKHYKENSHQGRYNADDICRLMRSLKSRDIDNLSSVAAELLNDI